MISQPNQYDWFLFIKIQKKVVDGTSIVNRVPVSKISSDVDSHVHGYKFNYVYNIEIVIIVQGACCDFLKLFCDPLKIKNTFQNFMP